MRLPTIGVLGVVMLKVMLVKVVRLVASELLLERDQPPVVVVVSVGTQRRLRLRGEMQRRSWRLAALGSVLPFGRTWRLAALLRRGRAKTSRHR